MSIRRLGLFVIIVGAMAVAAGDAASAQAPAGQAPARGAAQAKPAAPAARPAAASRAQGNLLQLMRGILYPASNVVFAAQSDDPATLKPAADPSTSPNPLTSSYGGWMAVENAGIALAEAANLLTIPGRRCGNGKPAPIQNADWMMFVQELREAGMVAAKAGQSKNQDAVLDAADKVSLACSNCHDVYREKTGADPLALRCTK
jgi:hypothetical protein